MYEEDRASVPFGAQAAKQAAYATTATEAARETPRNLLCEDIARNMKFAEELAVRTERMANLVVGTVPENSDERPSAGSGGGNGLLDALRSAASLQFRLLARVNEALNRMERDLG